MMQVMEDAVWLQFWENGQYRIIRAAQNGAVQERTFSGKTDASLTEHGAVGYDDTRKAFALWDGMQETPSIQSAHRLIRLAVWQSCSARCIIWIPPVRCIR